MYLGAGDTQTPMSDHNHRMSICKVDDKTQRTIRINREASAASTDDPDHGPWFRPIPIRGGPISDTVLNDRR